MNEIIERIEKELESKEEIKKSGSEESRKNFSWPAFFAGDEYNQELAKNSKIKEDNVIDFAKESKREKEFIENKISEIINSLANKQSIERKEFPVIWFKNVDKTENNSPLQKFLLTIFDPTQNHSLSIKGETVNLSNFVLITTSSTHDTGELPNPLFSRLDCINVDTAKPKEFFWDKYFYPALFATLLTFLTLALLLIYYSNGKVTEEKNIK